MSVILDVDAFNEERKKISENQLVVAVCPSAEGADNRWEQRLIDEIRARGYKAAVIVPHMDEEGNVPLNADYIISSQPEEWEKLKGINIFIADDRAGSRAAFPQNSLSAGVCRASADIDNYIYENASPYPLNFDAWIRPENLSQRSIDFLSELWRSYTDPGILKKREIFLQILPIRYSQAEDRGVQPPLAQNNISIIYSPAINNGISADKDRIVRVLRILASNFSDIKIILKLNCLDARQEILGLKNKLPSNTELAIEEFAEGDEDKQFNSIAIFEDKDMAEDFYNKTRRPPLLLTRDIISGLDTSNEKVVYISKFSDLIAAIKSIVSDEQLRINNPHPAYDVETFLNSLISLYEKKHKQEWPIFKWDYASNSSDEVALTRKMLSSQSPLLAYIAQYAAIFARPGSSLLYAFALHIGRESIPGKRTCDELTLLKNLNIGCSGDSYAYSDINPEAIKALYRKALLGFIKSKDIEGKTLVETLSEEFDKLVLPGGKKNKKLPASQQRPLSVNELKEKLRSLTPDAFVVGFYIEKEFYGQHEWLDALARECRKKGYITVGILTEKSLPDCSLPSVETLCVAAPGDIKNLERINVFIISDADQGADFPLTSRVLGCAHNFYLQPKGHSFGDAIHFAAHLDGWLQPSLVSDISREKIKHLWPGFISPDFIRRGRNDFYLIPAGYPRLAATQNIIDNLNIKPSSIVYAPRALSVVRNNFGIDAVQEYGLKLISMILNNFPDKEVIFRPTAYDLNEGPVKEIMSVFSSETRFHLDTSIDHTYSFANGEILITDYSNICMSFAFLTARPSITFRPELDNATGYSETGYGFSVSNIESLREVIGNYFSNPTPHIHRIELERDSRICPLRNSLSNIAEWLPDFYNGNAKEDWIPIKRDFDREKTPGELLRSMREYGKDCAEVANLSLITNHISPLLIAYSAHIGKTHTPKKSITPFLKYYIEQLTGRAAPDRFGDIDPVIINNLYTLAKNKAGDDKSVIELIEDTRDDFNFNSK